MKARPAAVEGSYECFFKAYFPDVYKSDNYMACYNFY